MATENPIRMSGSNERWSNSVPNRSGSAPPSIEGSFTAVDNLLSRQGGSGYNNLNRIPSPPIYYQPTEYQLVNSQVGRFRNNRGGSNKVYVPVQGSLKEVAEEETSQQQSVNSVADNSPEPNPQHSRPNSSNGDTNTGEEVGNLSDDVASIDINKTLDESAIVFKMKNTNISEYPREQRYARQFHQQQNNAVVIGQFHNGHQHVLQSSGFTPPMLYSPQAATHQHVYNMQSPIVYSPQPQYGHYGPSYPPNMVPQFIPGYPPHGSVPLIVQGGEMQYAPPQGQPSYQDPHKQDSMFFRGPGNPNIGRMGMMGVNGVNYYGVQPNMGIMVQYLPTPPGSFPYVETYHGWQQQQPLEGVNGQRLCNFLEELKSGKGRRFSLSDITGHVVEFSADQHGSRFIQQKLENCNPDEKAAVFREILPHACKLMIDVFGNYVIQKFFEYGNSIQRKELADQLIGQIIPLSLQMYGCRVIQKALDVIELDQRVRLARELEGHVMRCVRDQNGNHVIQKCVENIPRDRIMFMLNAFRGQVSSLSMHPYGCRVIQRLLERCSNDQYCRFITEEILESVCVLAKDQYGNYVTQHVLEKGTSDERERIVRKLSGHIVQLSLHKFASNVIEKCLEYGGRFERDFIVKEIAGADESYNSLLMMMKDQYGNYVVQKIFETCTVEQRGILSSRVRMHASALKKYTYGKHIVNRLERPFGEESQELRYSGSR